MSNLVRSVQSGAGATALLIALASPAIGQSSQAGEIRGQLVNAASQAPLAGAPVDVARQGQTASAARAVTAADGNFRVQGLAPGRYRVRVRALGFAPKDLPAEITAASPSVNLGTISLTAVPVELTSMEVTGKRQDVQFAPDRNTYVVRDMPTTRGGTALDVLRNIPSVDVDIDNIVSLRGNSGVTVQINGRPSPLKPQQLGNFLSTVSADMVERVEIIPNPSARDDPTGVAGIINIMLRQKADAGTNGALTLTGGTTGQANVGGNVGYDAEPWSLFASYGFLRDRRPRHDGIYRENRYQNPMTFLDESGRRLQLPLAHTLTTSATYQPSKRDEYTAETFFSTRSQDDRYNLVYRDRNSSGLVTGMSDRLSTGKGTEYSFESALAFKHSFLSKGHRLSGEARLVRDGEGGPGDIATHTLDFSGIATALTGRETADTRERPHENSLKIDYVLPLNSALRFETGYKGTLQNFHTTLDTWVFDTATKAFTPDSSRISNFTFDQNVQAVYAMLSGHAGKLQMQGGARVEHATTKFLLRTLGNTYHNPYSSFFPSALVAYNVDDAHQVKLSYSTRIRRPDEPDQLDPTIHYSDPLNLSHGNPYLKPEYIRALELGLQRATDRMTVLVNPYWRHTLDAVRYTRTIDNAGVTTRSPANVTSADAYGTDLTVAVSGGRVNGFVGGGAYKQQSNASNLAPNLSLSTFGWSARTNVTIKISGTVDAQALVNYQAAQDVEQGRNASRTRVNFAARKKLRNDRLNVTLRANDPFNTARERSFTFDPLFYQITDRTRTIRGLVLSVSWLFGAPPKKQRDLIDEGTP
jgi:outer membrane beta-barrel protein/carboxypeptidase family protein/TonB-dependent receptor-like protein